MQMQEGGEEMMTKNAVQQIEEAEHKAKEYQALAVEQAKKLLSDAERQGQAALELAKGQLTSLITGTGYTSGTSCAASCRRDYDRGAACL